MRVLRTSEIPDPVDNRVLFTGGQVRRQPIVTPEMSKNFQCNVVNFSRGARTKLHSHTSDQIMVITSGIGIVATEQEENVVTVGDIIHSPAGEVHWHGARKESYMSHFAITTADSQTTQRED